MALYYADGFDHYTTAQAAGMGWTFVNLATVTTAAVRSGTSGLRLQALSSANHGTLVTPRPGGVVGVAMRTSALGTQIPFLHIRDGATTHLSLTLSAGGLVQLRLGGSGGTILATGATVIAINVFHYYALKFVIDNATGSAELRLDGLGTAELTFSGDTRNGASAQWDGIAHECVGAALTNTDFDDLYACDDADSGVAGIPNNDFLGGIGGCQVNVHVPSTGNGSHTDWTPSTGTDHGALVDENPANDDTDYNDGVTVGDVDTYTFPPLGVAPSVIYGLLVYPRMKKTDASARSVCPVIRAGGVDYDGADVALSTSYGVTGEAFEADPSTGEAWTPAGFADAEFGQKVTV